MRKIVAFIILALAYNLPVFSQTKVPIEDAPKHVGETVTICAKVFSGRYLESSSTKPTLLNLGGAYPNHLLTVMINDADRKNFPGKLESDYTGKTICVTGKVIDYKGKPEIVISKPVELQMDGRSALP